MVVVYGIKEKLNLVKVQLSEIIHLCMQSVLGLEESRKFHRFVGLARNDFFYPEHASDAYTFIEINIIAGRKVETKKALISLIFDEIENRLGISADNIGVLVKEYPAHCFGFCGETGDELNVDFRYINNV